MQRLVSPKPLYVYLCALLMLPSLLCGAAMSTKTAMKDALTRPVSLAGRSFSALPSFVSHNTNPFLAGGGPRIASWLLMMLGCREAFKSPFYITNFSPTLNTDGSVMGTASRHDHIVRLCVHGSDGRYIQAFESTHDTSCYGAPTLNADGSVMATTSPHGIVRVFVHGLDGAYNPTPVFQSAPDTSYYAPTLNADGSVMAIRSRRDIVRIFIRSAGRYIQAFEAAHDTSCYGAPTLNTDGSVVATTGSHGIVRVFVRGLHGRYNPTPAFQSAPGTSNYAPSLNADGSVMATTSDSIRIARIFVRGVDGTYTQTFQSAPHTSFYAPTLNASGSIMATASLDGIVRIFVRGIDGRYRQTFKSDSGKSWSKPTLSADGFVIATLSRNGIIRLFVRGVDGTYRQTLVPTTMASSYAPTLNADGSVMAASHKDAARIFVPTFDSRFYKTRLTLAQLTFLYELYTICTSSADPEIIQLNAEQSALWHSLPIELIKLLIKSQRPHRKYILTEKKLIK